MDVSIEVYQVFLENAWDDAPAAANTLRQQLRINERTLVPYFSSGSLASVSKNSTSQSNFSGGVGRYTTAQLQSVWRNLISLYDSILLQTNWFFQNNVQWFLKLFPDYAQDPDPAVYAGMQWAVQGVENYQTDLTELRLQPTAYAGQFLPPNACW